MGIRTLVQMHDEVAGNIGRSNLTSEIKLWLFHACLDLGTYHKFYENQKKVTLTLSAAANTATVPDDFVKPIRLEYDDGSSILTANYKDFTYVRERYSYGTTRFPDYYARQGQLFYFDSTADQEYAMDLYHTFRPTYADFDADGEFSPYPAEWDHALILWATGKSFARIREWQASQHYYSLYNAYVKGRLGDMTKSEDAYNESFAGDIDEDPYGF